MTRWRVAARAVWLLLAGWGASAHAQSVGQPAGQAAARPVTVRGVAFDSLHNVPLANAFVILTERSQTTTSDDKGRFVFEAVPPGTYHLSMQHAIFDTLGLSGASARVTVTDGKTPVVLAVPAFASFWNLACRGMPLPAADTGFVYGTVRDARAQQPVAQATVRLSWIDLVNLGTKTASNVTQRRWTNEAQADLQGGYTVCGVPTDIPLQLRANYLGNATGDLALAASADRVRRRDLIVPGRTAADSALRGVVSGGVVDAGGRPVADVRVILENVREVRTDAGGRFLLRDVPTGSHQLEFASVGMTPVTTDVDILAADTTMVSATLRTVTNLQAMSVLGVGTRGRAVRRFEERRQQGFGAYMDSTTIGSRATLSAVFAGFAGVTVQAASANGRRFNIYLPSTGSGPCLAMLQVDGIQQIDHEILGLMHPDDIAAVEVYPQRTTIPTDLMRTDARCGLVAVWTKRAFR
ncbi:MAG: carboxypeptidase-like regulatory domain-containing protein [Gemmatimonadota bacterium]|nr:carboxypeptidase-like regulatory domain-containing protein [Gemmatimonadota bacterium]MDQ8168742.1 carboxypeptidase-like regulatory domain-containing protein [Gemmatimonadota bacterium]MDQ8172397.1 carboxypeptidase-like regulatory domain-containing protein [Gemmatimonadota bacterium]